MPVTSLIVATYNWPEALNLCLLSIKSQKVLPAEVIIADDGSGQETKFLIEKFQHNFPVPLIHVWHEDQGFRKSIILIQLRRLQEIISFRLMETLSSKRTSSGITNQSLKQMFLSEEPALILNNSYCRRFIVPNVSFSAFYPKAL